MTKRCCARLIKINRMSHVMFPSARQYCSNNTTYVLEGQQPIPHAPCPHAPPVPPTEERVVQLESSLFVV